MADHECADRRCAFCRATRTRTPSRGFTPVSSWDALDARAGRDVISSSRLEELQTNLSTNNLEELERLALIDKETGLYNSRTLLRELAREVARTRRTRTQVSACMITFSLPRYMELQHGASIKSVVMKLAAEAVMKAMRETDVAGRCGANELAVILPDCRVQHARLFAERLRYSLNDAIRIKSHLSVVGIHVAVAAFPAQPKGTARQDDVLDKMRTALHGARDESIICLA